MEEIKLPGSALIVMAGGDEGFSSEEGGEHGNDSNGGKERSEESSAPPRCECCEDCRSEEVEVLRAALNETRPTLETIESFLSDIDDKAGRTLRLNIAIIGILLTALSIGFSQGLPGTNRVLNGAFFFGLIASSISIVAALLTYTRSTITAGLGVQDIDLVLERDDISEEAMLRAILRSHKEWIRTNGRTNERDASSLFVSHVFLLLSMGYYALAVLWVIIQPIPQSVLLYAGIIGLTLILVFIIYLPQWKRFEL